MRVPKQPEIKVKELKEVNVDLEIAKIFANQLGDALETAFRRGNIMIKEFIQSLLIAIAKMGILRLVASFFNPVASITGSGFNPTGSVIGGSANTVVLKPVFENTIDSQTIVYKGIKQEIQTIR